MSWIGLKTALDICEQAKVDPNTVLLIYHQNKKMKSEKL